jgi:hypothetical protein
MFIDDNVSRCVYIISIAQLITLTLYSVHVSGLKLRTVEQTIASALHCHISNQSAVAILVQQRF